MHNKSYPWPETIIAGLLIALIGGVVIVSIVKYNTVDEAMKVWTTLGSVVGVVTGAVVTFFFKQREVNNLEGRAEEAKSEARTARDREEQVRRKARDLSLYYQSAMTKISGTLSPGEWDRFENDPTIKTFAERALTVNDSI